jgi:acetylornithine/succinyldiaminopimelate/putrescine aminotransferase
MSPKATHATEASARDCGSIFQPAGASLLSLLERRNVQGALTFLSPINYVSREAAKVGYVLNQLANRGRSSVDQTVYRTFFGNSQREAIHGAIKVLRHGRFDLGAPQLPILLHDPDGSLERHFNPLSRASDDALVPGLLFESDSTTLLERARTESLAGVFFRGEGAEPTTARRLAAQCADRGVIFILDSSHLDPSTRSYPCESIACDIAVFGESLTRHEVPFGAFSMTRAVHRPWNTLKTCLVHASTFGGNGLALEAVLEVLHETARLGTAERRYLESISRTYSAARQAYARYVNPKAVTVYRLLGMDRDFAGARGSRLQTRDGGEYVDCINCAGCSLRGHNPPDLVGEVLREHEPDHDYFEDLRRFFCEQTKLEHAFPAVSGAHAVELAITTALLARPQRTRILTFTGNFAGCTLIAMAATAAGVDQFRPLYHDIKVLDAWSAEGRSQLETELRSGEVALVWFEPAQAGVRYLPQEVFDLLNKHRAEGGYLIGVDEVQSGVGRTGRFAAHQERLIDPDVITFAKAMSDMTFPIAIALASSAVVEEARRTNATLIDDLLVRYRNQLGAHISVHAVRKAIAAEVSERASMLGRRLRAGLERVVRTAPAITEVIGLGLNCKFQLPGEKRIEGFYLATRLADSGVILYGTRGFLRAQATEDEVDEVIARARRAVAGMQRWRLRLGARMLLVRNRARNF